MTSQQAPATPFDAYNPPTAGGQATRQIIDVPLSPLEIDPLTRSAELPILPSSARNTSTSNDPSSATFEPHIFRRTSTNYADADAASRHAEALSREQASGRSSMSEDNGGRGAQDREKDGDRKDQRDSGIAGAGVSWKPQFGRTQSWDQQDWKHTVQMGGVVGKHKAEEHKLGFSEKGGHSIRFSQS